ncbi:hypothetical protein [Paenibacillus massiliensis]|uniref:hypothetical protein n=1 Tax=Paenibacillus massiliensis TaxID=225917 RepID=UPI0012DD4DC1|nr:hypothetical protein [Paenibacillus massiliensis]
MRFEVERSDSGCRVCTIHSAASAGISLRIFCVVPQREAAREWSLKCTNSVRYEGFRIHPGWQITNGRRYG